MRLATYASVSVACVLIVTKFAAWVMTDSVSLLSTLIDSLLDAAASLVNLFAVRHALQPADDEHRFGHGKAEPLAGLAQSAFIVGSAAFLMIQAVERLYNPIAISHPEIGYGVMVFSIVLTVALVIFQRYVIGKSGSVAISADSLHYQTDVLINASVLVSIYLASEMGYAGADPMFAIGIALFIVWSAWKIGTQALDILMDHELPDEDRRRIVEIACEQNGVDGVHDLRTRSSGTQVFIQMHVEMDGAMTLRRAHEIADAVELKIAYAFPHAEIIVHQDPEGLEDVEQEFS
ncbi:MAG: cation diffusion facilitator family transporter [Rhodospirillaceae bacterium]|nr:cation diffusion facilitator family transporter [Rhodospirillaceae bacterium]